jgi:hypothetical protein
VFPSRSRPKTASLSFGFMLAFWRKSFGSTIWPLASTVTIASILQRSVFFDIVRPLSTISVLIIKTFLKIKINPNKIFEGEAISNYGKNIFGVAKTVIPCWVQDFVEVYPK